MSNNTRGQKFKIRCNPYTKTIGYRRWNDEKQVYCNPAPQSKLTAAKYTKGVTIQNIIQEIFEHIRSDYIGDNTDWDKINLDICFEGTLEDYNDICGAQKVFFPKGNIIYTAEIMNFREHPK